MSFSVASDLSKRLFQYSLRRNFYKITLTFIKSVRLYCVILLLFSQNKFIVSVCSDSCIFDFFSDRNISILERINLKINIILRRLVAPKRFVGNWNNDIKRGINKLSHCQEMSINLLTMTFKTTWPRCNWSVRKLL